MNNLKYLIENWIRWDKKSLLYFFIRIPAQVLLPIVTAYIPKVIIECITEGVTVTRMIFVIALLSFVLSLVTWLDPYIREILKGSSNIIRMRYAILAFRKNLNMDYIDIESLEGRNKYNQASGFYKSDQSPASLFIDNLGQTFVCIIGVVASITLLYRVNSFMILLVLVNCIFEFFLLRSIFGQELILNKTKNKETVKFYYYYDLGKDFYSAKDIKLYNFDQFFSNKLNETISNLKLAMKKFIPYSFKINGIRALLNFIREFIVYSYLVYLTYNGNIEVSEFVFYFGIISGFSNWIIKLVGSISEIEYCCKECAIYREYIENNQIHKRSTNIDFTSIDSLELKNVSFRYSNSNNNTLNNISFNAKKGENIAIIGENGAGKTTIIKLICGLYNPTKGKIYINGKDNTLFSKENYFDLFSVVFQDYSFMPITIAENITAQKNYDKERLYYALKKAGILQKIITLENKEKTMMLKEIYNDAAEFSGGEKQKLLLAKAIYKDSPILILDEPTASLDPISEENLYKRYSEITKNKISFFISHRLSSTRFCDRILFISNGQIVENGTHEELMNLKGFYYKMYQAQSFYYKEMNINYE